MALVELAGLNLVSLLQSRTNQSPDCLARSFGVYSQDAEVDASKAIFIFGTGKNGQLIVVLEAGQVHRHIPHQWSTLLKKGSLPAPVPLSERVDRLVTELVGALIHETPDKLKALIPGIRDGHRPPM